MILTDLPPHDHERSEWSKYDFTPEQLAESILHLEDLADQFLEKSMYGSFARFTKYAFELRKRLGGEMSTQYYAP